MRENPEPASIASKIYFWMAIGALVGAITGIIACQGHMHLARPIHLAFTIVSGVVAIIGWVVPNAVLALLGGAGFGFLLAYNCLG